MKNLKNYFRVAFIALFTGALLLACSQDDTQMQDFKNDAKSISTDNSISANKFAATSCDITGSLVVNANGTYTYTYVNNTNNVNINWTVVAGNMSIVSGNGTSTVTVTFASNFTGGTLTAYGTGGNDDCQKTINISLASGGGGDICSCPNPVIRCTLAVSGGHPYWRFQLDNLQPNETFVWSSLHAPIFGSVTNNSYVIANPTGPAFSGFTMYCEVTRRCSNGTLKKRKAYYTNYYGGTTTTGTSGFVDIGGSCDSSLLE